jgi:4-hydroxy-tetrahydrodipicolinate reductase
MKLIIVAPRGKMGKFITEIAAANDQIEIVGGVGPKGRDYIGRDIGEVAMIGKTVGAPVVDDIESIIDSCDVIIDFSTVENGMAVLDAARRHGKALVCGSTGFSPEQRQAFEDAAQDIPVMLAANTSRLVNIMYKLIQLAAEKAGDVDVEILDMHDNTKLDAPSGTAKEIGEIVAEARGVNLEDEAVYGRSGRCPRQKGNIGFHSLRGGDIPSSHTVYFVGTGERLEITHHSGSFKCFAAGAVDAALWLAEQPKGSYVIQETFGL